MVKRLTPKTVGTFDDRDCCGCPICDDYEDKDEDEEDDD